GGGLAGGGELSNESYESASDRLLMGGDSLKSLEVRLDVWKEAVSLVAGRPLLGIGPETFGRTHPEAEAIGFGGVPDRAHNEVLDVLLNSGIVGLFAYLSLLFYVFLVCYRGRSDPLIVACAASLAGLFAANMFGFSTTVHHMIWWAILGVVVARTGAREAFGFFVANGRVAMVIRGVIVMAVVVSVAAAIFNFGFRVLYADYLYSSGVEKVFEFKQEEATEYFKKAAEYNPVEEYYRLGEREEARD
ncbi:MAG: O-antigen ligase family protein, partial [Candidatus Gracilibacteria bacterium]